jgi:tetratricopeptide (TPR) repeat protein
MGTSLMCSGDIVQGRAHYDQAFALYDAAEHRPLAARFGQDVGVSILIWRSPALWALGYPEAALADADQAVKDAREIGQVATLMYALYPALFSHIFCGNYAAASTLVDELVALADEKDALLWKAFGMMSQGCLAALTGKASKAVETITFGITAFRSTGARLWLPLDLSYLARADAELGKFDEAWRYIGEAMMAIETNQRKVARGRDQSHRWRNCAVDARTGCGESGSALQARSHGRS